VGGRFVVAARRREGRDRREEVEDQVLVVELDRDLECFGEPGAGAVEVALLGSEVGEIRDLDGGAEPVPLAPP
jgi:hypothetical protein